MFCVFVWLWLTSYCVIHAYCVLWAIIWVRGMDVYIICLRVYRGHTCVCSTDWLPE